MILLKVGDIMEKQYSKSYLKRRKYYLKNRDKIIAEMKVYNILYTKKNKEKISLKSKRHYENNKEKRLKQIHQYQTDRKKIDPNYKLSKDLRHLLNQAINYFERNGTILECKKYPIDFKAIIVYLSPFPDRKVYQIDHIKPLCSFNLTDPEQIKFAFSPDNHQWITPKQNMEKGKK